jgi:site-specific DNA-methyltransferase (adenine-specific)
MLSLRTMIPILKTPLGELYQSDCLTMLRVLEPETVDLAFADPPLNLGKQYSSKIDDAKTSKQYLDWSKNWLDA